MLFRSYAGQFDPRTLDWARQVHDRILGGLPLVWARKGTWMEAWNGSRRVALAPHRNGATLYFPGPEPVEAYRRLGGTCPSGKVSIRIPFGADFEDALLRRVILDHLGWPGDDL